MPENTRYLPEGLGTKAPHTLRELTAAMERGDILEGAVERCDTHHTLHIPLGAIAGQIPREEALSPWISGSQREIALLSQVGRQVCFRVQAITADSKGAPIALLNRRAVQEEAIDWFSEHLGPGTVLPCRVTHLESFGAFLDIGCGVIAMLPIERISVSRISHPEERFSVGQKILAAIWAVDPVHRRFTMTHRELLGTWMENASYFAPGETVRGIVRSVKEYGSFIELTPNLSGLADAREGLSPGDAVSVYIKSIRPERMKIKLQIIQRLPRLPAPPFSYRITDGRIRRWTYSPPGCEKAAVETVFQETV